MNNTVIIILSVRNIKSFTDCINKLPCEKIWFKGYKEIDLIPIVNKFVEESNFENYFITPDDLIIKPHQFDLLLNGLNRHNIVTGWGCIRQNCTFTTATKTKNFIEHTIFKDAFTSRHFLLSQYNFSYKTHEINALPDEFETAFTGWFYTGMKRKIWLEYPYECLAPPHASSDLMFSRRILKDKKYKQICFKNAHVVHISNTDPLNSDSSFFNPNECFKNKSIIKTF